MTLTDPVLLEGYIKNDTGTINQSLPELEKYKHYMSQRAHITHHSDDGGKPDQNRDNHRRQEHTECAKPILILKRFHLLLLRIVVDRVHINRLNVIHVDFVAPRLPCGLASGCV